MQKIKNWFKKIKNWFIENRDVFEHLLVLAIALGVFFGYASCHTRTASAEEVDSSMTEEEWLESLNDVQPPSIQFRAEYEDGVYVDFPVVTPSFVGDIGYAHEGYFVNPSEEAILNVYSYTIEGLTGNVDLLYEGVGSNTSTFEFFPVYTLTFTNIYTRFTDTFEWGFIELDNPVSNVQYEFEIYDFRQYEFEHIIYDLTFTDPDIHIPISPTDVLDSWWRSQKPLNPATNPFQYFLVIPNHEPVAYIKSMTVRFADFDEAAGMAIKYTGNLNMDEKRYLDALQFIGDGDVIEEIDSLFVFRSIVDSVDSFMSTEILPNFSFYDILYIAIGIPLTIWLLKLWLGG